MVTYTLLASGSILGVLNPVAAVPPFLAMTQGNSAAERRLMARKACMIAASVLAVFTVLGLRILSFFGISVAAFQIAGGIVLIRVAFALLHGVKEARMATEEKLEGLMKDDISVTPLGFPVLCGPATITSSILVASQAAHWLYVPWLLILIGLIYAGIYVLLTWASANYHRLGETGVILSSRMMGLILLAIAVQFVVDGIKGTGIFA